MVRGALLPRVTRCRGQKLYSLQAGFEPLTTAPMGDRLTTRPDEAGWVLAIKDHECSQPDRAMNALQHMVWDSIIDPL